MKKYSLLILLLLVGWMQMSAAVRLPNIIGSHMVLQQKSTVKIWGWAGPSEKVTIKTNWDNASYEAITSNGAKWEASIKTPVAGGPYQITISASNTIVLEDVLIGEVWVCSGQSNMEWSGDQGLKETLDEAPNATNTSIRFFYVAKSTANFPQDNLEGKWMVCSPEEMKHFSAIGYFFGKNLNQALNSPIGLINSNWGGTPAETWTPEYVINNDAIIKKGADSLNEAAWWPHKSAKAYNAMIYPLTNFSIAGVLWYQGESNTGTHFAYEKLFTGMIDAWRHHWNQNFPFYFVQIAPFTYGNQHVGALLREAQTKAANHMGTAMVVITDLIPDTTNIHPTRKIEVAKRLSDLALNKTYGLTKIACQSPIYQSNQIDKDKITIQFNHVPNGLVAKGESITCFEIAGEDKIFYPAQAKIVGGTIVVSNKNIKNPRAVRFAFNNTDMPNLFNQEGLPVNLFRTDNWEVDTAPIKK